MPTVNRIGQSIFEVELNGRIYTRYTMESLQAGCNGVYRAYTLRLIGKYDKPYVRRLNQSRNHKICTAIDCAISDWIESREVSEKMRRNGQGAC